MKKPISKPAGAGFIPFKASSLPPGVELIHKLPHGNVDLQFHGKGQQLDQLRQQFGSFADEDMSFETASKSGCIRLRVPPLDTTQAFSSQVENSLLGIITATRLLGLYEKGSKQDLG